VPKGHYEGSPVSAAADREPKARIAAGPAADDRTVPFVTYNTLSGTSDDQSSLRGHLIVARYESAGFSVFFEKAFRPARDDRKDFFLGSNDANDSSIVPGRTGPSKTDPAPALLPGFLSLHPSGTNFGVPTGALRGGV
jgi:hypothetical protein